MVHDLVDSASYMAHGYCLLWKPWLVVLHAGSDLLIFLAYFAIPAAIWLFLRQRPDLELKPLAILFACGLNSVRSPIAAALFGQIFGRGVYVGSAGVRKGELDPFAVAVMAEIGLDISRHKPLTFEELEEWEGLNFDLIVSLAPEAHHRALELTRTNAVDVEYWPTADPTAAEGSREQRLEAYRQVRDQILARIRERFIPRGPGNE